MERELYDRFITEGIAWHKRMNQEREASGPYRVAQVAQDAQDNALDRALGRTQETSVQEDYRLEAVRKAQQQQQQQQQVNEQAHRGRVRKEWSRVVLSDTRHAKDVDVLARLRDWPAYGG